MKKVCLRFVAQMLLASLPVASLAQVPRFAPSHIPAFELPVYYTGEALDFYGQLTGKTVLASINQLRLPVSISTNPPAGTNEARSLIEEEIARQGFAMVPHGSQFTLVVPQGWTNSPVAEQLAALGSPPIRGPETAINMFNFPSVDLNTFLNEFYAPLCGYTFLRAAALPSATLHLVTMYPLTHDETMHAFNVLLALNDIAAIKDGEKFTQLVPLAMKPLVEVRAPKPKPGAEWIDPTSIPVFKPLMQLSAPVPGATQPQMTQPWPPVQPQIPTTEDLIDYYAKLTGKTAAPSAGLPRAAVTLEIKSSLTKAELLYAIETTLALNGVAIVEVDGNTIRAGHISEKRPTPNPPGGSTRQP